MTMKKELFKKDSCPYCQKVMAYIAATGRKDIVYRDIIECPENADTLVRVGGKRQVPCLFIDGSPLYESMDIIRWLQEHPGEDS